MGKITDFTIVKTNTNPKFVGEHISLEDVTHFTDGIVKPPHTPKPKKPSKLDRILTRFDEIDSRLDKMDSRLDKMDIRIDALTTTVEGLVVDMKEVKATLIQHTNRMDKHWGVGK